jgi:hypothetical protein
MTNAEKYKEIFGLTVDPCMCPSKECVDCPCRPNIINDEFCPGGSTLEWWNREYKGNQYAN